MVLICGFEKIDYVSKRTNKRVQGVKIHCNDYRTITEGVAVLSFYVDQKCFDNFFSSVSLGDSVDLFYNQYGSVCGCRKAE